MATSYPGSLDNFTNPTSTSPINSPSHADQHSNANDAIEAIEGELGTNPKGTKATVKARLDDVDTAIALKAPIESPTFTGTVTIPAGSAITGIPYLATANTFTSNQIINNNSSTTPVIVTRNATGQTANIAEFKNESGVSVARISTGGSYFSPSVLTAGSYSTTLGTITSIINSASTIGLVIRGVASQTADLQQWQDSAGTALATLDAYGHLKTSGYVQVGLTNGIVVGGAFIIRANYGSNNSINIGNGVATQSAAQVQVTNSAAGIVGLIVRGAVSQTANLQQWQNSAGTVLASISSDGTIRGGGSFLVDGTYGITNIRAGTLGGSLNVGTGYSAQQGIIVRGAASQTANLQEWQNSAGTVLSKVDSNGNISTNNISYSYSLPDNVATGFTWMNIGTWTTVQNGSALKISVDGKAGYNAQSGQLWNSDLYFVTSNDSSFQSALDSNAFYAAGLAYRNTELGSSNVNIDPKFRILQNSKTSYTIYVKVYQWLGAAKYSVSMSQGTSWTNNATNIGATAPTGTVIEVTPTSSVSTAGGSIIVPSSASTNGLIIRAAASQTADFQVWQDSGGTVLTNIDKNGYIRTPLVEARPTNPGLYGLFVAANASQSGDLFQVADISNNAYTGISSTGKFVTGNTTNASRFTQITDAALGQLTVYSPSASTKSIVVRGAASQTANLQEWQRSNGNPDLLVTNFGALVSGGGTTIASNPTINAYGAAMKIASGVNTYPMLILQAAASQSANIQEWQNSAGTVLSNIRSDGTIASSYFDNPAANGSYLQANAGASIDIIARVVVQPTFRVKGAASQTADLQQWQNSSGTVLTSIFPSGNISIGTTQAGVHGQANSQGVVTTETAPLIVRGSAPGQNMIELWAYGKDAYITGAVGNGTSVTYTTSIAHGFTTSDYVTVNGIIGNPGSGTLNVGGGATVSAVTTYTFTLPNTTTQTYISGGYARNAQYPGNILQAYRSDGMSLFTIGSSGGFAMADVMSVANVGYQQAGISVQPNLPSSAAIRMYGRSAQTAEILDVRNYIYKSGGSDSIFAIVPDYSVSANADGYGAWVRMKNAATPTTNPTSAGYLYVGSGALNYMGTSNVPQQIVGADGSVKFTSPAASIVPLIIQHASSPSSSYFEIRNSAGNPVWGINSAGESLTRTTTKYGANIQNDSNNNNTALSLSAPSTSGSGIALYVYSGSTTRDMVKFDNSGVVKLTITSDGSLKGGNSNTISVNTASTVDTVALSSFTSMEYTLSIKQGSKIRSSKILVHTDGTSVDSTEYGIMEMGGGITGILVTASVSSTNAILQVTITDAATTNATVKLIKTML